MSQDYRLAKLYEQVYNKQSKPAEKEKPKSLHEAYKSMLVERTAFYKLDIGSEENTQAPQDPSGMPLKLIGVTDQPIRITSTINAISIEPSLEKLMKLADQAEKGWHQPPIKGVSLHSVAQLFLQNKIPSHAVDFIALNKNKLTACQQNIMTNDVQTFNLRDITVNDLFQVQGDSGKIPADKTDINNLYNELFKLTAAVGKASTGAGEIATTLLTNAKKGITGDLVFGKNKVEIKGLDGRLGKASFSAEGTSPALAKFLKDVNSTQTGFKRTYQIRSTIFEKINLIEDNDKLKEIVSLDYLNTLKALAKNINDINQIKQIVNKSQIGANDITFKDIANRYLKHNGVAISDDIKNEFKKIHDTVKDAIKNLLKFDFKSPENTPFTPEFFEKNTYTITVPRFFLTDLGLTSEQAARAFLKTKSTGEINEEEYFPAIYKYFTEHYEEMKHGSRRKLEAILFAYLLTIYSTQHGGFQYFTMINDNTQEAISFNTTGDVNTLMERFSTAWLSNKNLKMDIKADNTFGACSVAYKK